MRHMPKQLVVVLLATVCLIACTSSPSNARATEIAFEIFSTQTAQVPTITPTPSSTPTKTLIPTATQIPTTTPDFVRAGWKEHSSFNFSLALPEDWEVILIDEEGIESIWNTLENFDTEWANITTELFSSEVIKDMIELWAMDSVPAGFGHALVAVYLQEQYVETSVDELCVQIPAIQESMGIHVLESSCDQVISDLKGLRFTVLLEVGPIAIKEYLFVIHEGNHLWSIVFAVDETSWSEYEPLFSDIMTTFRPNSQSCSLPEYQRTLDADWIIGERGFKPGQFSFPTDLVVNASGEIYVVDSFNHRIQHLNEHGEVLNVWGEFGSIEQGEAPGGTFNEPWGIGMAHDGSLYVADTWNHRIQHFTSEGDFLNMFGQFGQQYGQSGSFMFWGPRDVAVDPLGRIYLTDTGNKRIAVFDPDGRMLGVISNRAGSGHGEFDEPVSLALSDSLSLFITDTWNQRVQIISSNGEYIYQWPIEGWYGYSIENKPYIALDNSGRVALTDPERYFVMVFDGTGSLQYCFGGYGENDHSFGLPLGLAFDSQGGLYVADAANNRIMHFTLQD